MDSWPQVNKPIRMIYIVREMDKPVIQAGKKQSILDTKEMWVATTCEEQRVSTETIVKIARRRWDIENIGFHDLKTYWNMDHCFVHDEHAIESYIRILLLAVNFFFLYLYRHLRGFRETGIPMKEVAQEMKEQCRWNNERLSRYLFDSS